MHAVGHRPDDQVIAHRPAATRRAGSRSAVGAAAAGQGAALLQLQRSAGNRAVAAMVGGQPVQRCGETPPDECPCHDDEAASTMEDAGPVDARVAVARQADSCPPGRVWDDPPGRCFSRTPNGCGPANKWYSRFIPNTIPGTFNFEPYCNRHDVCYGTPFKTQSECDLEFRDGMRRSCRLSLLRGPGAYARCLGAAEIYYRAVSMKGADAFRSAQGL